MIEKVRLDVAMLERGFVDSREKGKALIMAGLVYVNGQKETKAGTSVKAEDCIELRGEKMPYVSRGGYKLEKAVKEFNLDLNGCVCMDIGASTGGFTDCMLILLRNWNPYVPGLRFERGNPCAFIKRSA